MASDDEVNNIIHGLFARQGEDTLSDDDDLNETAPLESADTSAISPSSFRDSGIRSPREERLVKDPKTIFRCMKVLVRQSVAHVCVQVHYTVCLLACSNCKRLPMDFLALSSPLSITNMLRRNPLRPYGYAQLAGSPKELLRQG
jgi:hypothetical protein